MRKTRRRMSGRRHGAIALSTAILLIVLLGLIALAVDVGYIMLTRTQLQAAADSGTLSGGTELMAGLGDDPVAASTVAADGTSAAVDFAGRNPNGDQTSSFADGARDVQFGWAKFNSGATPPQWEKHWGEELPAVGGYNMIRVTLRRDQVGSSNGDVPMPLIFARVFGHDLATLGVDATAVIMPAKGIRIIPGSPSPANVVPFAITGRIWEKYLRAQDYFESNGYPDPVDSVTDAVTGEPLFGHYNPVNGPMGTTVQEFNQDFADLWSCACNSTDAESTPVLGTDGKLELDIYPRDDYTSGNFGTIDIGGSGNSTADIERQLVNGVDADDLSYYANNEFVIPRTTTGDTGLSAGIKDELDSIAGMCKVALLASSITNPGNNATFALDGLAGIRVMHSELTGSAEFKHLRIQRCDAKLGASVADIDTQIGEDTTVFTPLILIE